MKNLMAKFKTFQPIDFLTIGVVVVALLVSLITLGMHSGSSDEDEALIEENRTKIVNLTAKRDTLKDGVGNVVSEEDAARVLKYATNAGIAMANLQTEYQDCVVWRDSDTVSVEEKITKQAESVGEWLTADSQGSRVPWFVSSKSDMVRSSRFTWRFMTNYGFTSDSVDVLWLCVDSNERLVAFAIGNYIASENKFSNVKYYATQYGNVNYRTADEAVAYWAESLDESPGYEIVVPQEPVQTDLVVDPAVDPNVAPGVDPAVDPNEQGETPVEPPVEQPVEQPPEQPAEQPDNLGWAQDFEDEFKASQEYRDYIQSKKNGGQ